MALDSDEETGGVDDELDAVSAAFGNVTWSDSLASPAPCSRIMNPRS